MIININGVGQVEVPDSFMSMSVTEQNALVDRIRQQTNEIVKNEVNSGAVDENLLGSRIRSVAQGLLLGFADEAEAAIFNPLSAIGAATGFGQGEDYSKALEGIRGGLKDYQSARPLESMAYEMGGAVLPTAAAALLTAPAGGAGGAAVGTATAARLAPTMLRAAAMGALEGGIAGFGAGEGGFSNRMGTAATGAALGGTVGAVAPVAVERGARLARSVGDSLGIGGASRAATVAERKVLEALQREGMTPDEALARLQEARGMGITDITTADLGENLRGLGWRSQAVPNETRQGVVQQFAERRAGQAGQIAEGATEMAGVRGATGIDYVDELDRATRAMAKPAYDAAYQVILNPKPFQKFAGRKVVADAYKVAQDLAEIRGDGTLPPFSQFVSGNGIPTEVAHNVKRGIDALIEAETDAVTGKVTSRGRELINLKNDFNGEIIKQNGAYESANKMFADRSRLQSAYDAGSSFNRIPEKELARNVSKMTAQEKESLRVGIVSKVQELASVTGDASDFTTTIFGSPQRRAALRLAFDDPKEFDRFEKFIKIQQDKVRTARKVMGGSETAERLMQRDDSGVDPSSVMSILGQAGTGNVTGAAYNAAQNMMARAQGIGEQGAADMSRMLFSADPAQQASIMQRLGQRNIIDKKMRSRLSRRPDVYSGLLGANLGLQSGRD